MDQRVSFITLVVTDLEASRTFYVDGLGWLAHNVATRRGVDTVLEHAAGAGATEVGQAVEREWGGYTGYFADPDGFRWEVAHNPGDLGQTVLP